MKHGLIVIGSSNTDLVVKVEKLPKEGETVLGEELKIFYGGKGANQAIAAKKAGADVLFITKLGRDIYGERYQENLIAHGIDPSGIIFDDKAPSGIAIIAIDKKGENQIVVSPGSNLRLLPSDIDNIKNHFHSKAVMLLQLEIPLETVEHSLRIAKSMGIRTVLNPAPARKLSKKMIKNIDILTPNETELKILTGLDVKQKQGAEEAAMRLLDLGAAHVMITLGEKGSFLLGRDKKISVPAYRVKAVDSTAAGDAFNGVLADSLLRGMSLEDAMRYANAAGALTVTKMGAQPSLPFRQEIERFLNQEKT